MLMLGFTTHKELKPGDFCLIHISFRPTEGDDFVLLTNSAFPRALEGTWRGRVAETNDSAILFKRENVYQIAATFDDAALELTEQHRVWQNKEPDIFYSVWPSTLRNEATLEVTRLLQRIDARVLAFVARARERIKRLRTKTDDRLSNLVVF